MRNVVVDALLGVGVGAELLCCVGVLAMRNAADRLHYAAAGATVGPLLVLAALLVREGLAGPGLQATAAVALLLVGGPVVVHALGRAIRSLDYGGVEALPEEKGG